MKYRLVLSDVDSTLIQEEVIDLLAIHSGRGEEVSKITRAAMSGDLDFKEALRQRVGTLKGLPVSIFERVAAQVNLSPGAVELREFCRSSNVRFGAVTGGFYQVLNHIPFFQELDFLRANSLEVKDGFLTGGVEGEILDRVAKAKYLEEFAREANAPLAECVAIGDGANDLDMVNRAGLGISFRGKKILRASADVSIEESLTEVIGLLS
ncbi:MAG: phosphoserine phosphatase SerB [Actinobacteria bacterium]|nr:phosphoserine phosphatase SerB [Actinomycetota bacterium]